MRGSRLLSPSSLSRNTMNLQAKAAKREREAAARRVRAIPSAAPSLSAAAAAETLAAAASALPSLRHHSDRRRRRSSSRIKRHTEYDAQNTRVIILFRERRSFHLRDRFQGSRAIGLKKKGGRRAGYRLLVCFVRPCDHRCFSSPAPVRLCDVLCAPNINTSPRS